MQNIAKWAFFARFPRGVWVEFYKSWLKSNKFYSFWLIFIKCQFNCIIFVKKHWNLSKIIILPSCAEELRSAKWGNDLKLCNYILGIHVCMYEQIYIYFYPMPWKIQPIRGQDYRCIFCSMQWVVFHSTFPSFLARNSLLGVHLRTSQKRVPKPFNSCEPLRTFPITSGNRFQRFPKISQKF